MLDTHCAGLLACSSAAENKPTTPTLPSHPDTTHSHDRHLHHTSRLLTLLPPSWTPSSPLQDLDTPAASFTIQFAYTVEEGRLRYSFRNWNTSVTVNETYALHIPGLQAA